MGKCTITHRHKHAHAPIYTHLTNVLFVFASRESEEEGTDDEQVRVTAPCTVIDERCKKNMDIVLCLG